MITSDVLAHALPGRENAKDWLTMKIVECMASPMNEQIAGKLNTYNGAYNAICQWDEEEAPQQKSSSVGPFTMDTAKEWTNHMQNEDGTTGPHWTFEQARQVMTQRSINCDPYEFWAALNMIYSDYCKVAKKHNVGGNIDFYVDMAKAFLDDKDAGPDKLFKYYEYIVK